ncbi:MAG: hypothetical protein AAFQ80_04050 [Cyanobacteria bacterium J06621_8]
MLNNYRQYFCIYLAWHPQSSDSQKLAEHIFKYIYGDPEYPLVNDIRIPVKLRSQSANSQTESPKAIELNNSLNSAAFVFVDAHMVMSDSWQFYVEQLWQKAQSLAPHHRIYPVAMTPAAYNLSPRIAKTNFIKLGRGTEIEVLQKKLLRVVLHAASRQLKQIQSGTQTNLEQAPPAIKLFLSHAKQDGVDTAKNIRRWIEEVVK